MLMIVFISLESGDPMSVCHLAGLFTIALIMVPSVGIGFLGDMVSRAADSIALTASMQAAFKSGSRENADNHARRRCS